MNMPINEKQIQINRNYIDKEINRIKSILDSIPSKMEAVLVIHWDPLLDTCESRVALFEDHFLTTEWAANERKIYETLEVPFSVYFIYNR